MLGEKAYIFKAQYLHGKHGRICRRHKREGECALPGEVSKSAWVLLSPRGDGKDFEKSAEGIVGEQRTENLLLGVESIFCVFWADASQEDLSLR